jgi:hypothetical protein
MTDMILLIVHGLLAVALIGAVTHQAIVAWPAARPAVQAGQPMTLFTRLRVLRSGIYTNAVVILYAVDFLLGAILYASYRVEVRPYLEDGGMFLPAGAFEAKEHLSVLGLGLLPAYWLSWKAPSLAENVTARRYITLLLAFFVWWSFFIGHILNNIRGLPL